MVRICAGNLHEDGWVIYMPPIQLRPQTHLLLTYHTGKSHRWRVDQDESYNLAFSLLTLAKRYSQTNIYVMVARRGFEPTLCCLRGNRPSR